MSSTVNPTSLSPEARLAFEAGRAAGLSQASATSPQSAAATDAVWWKAVAVVAEAQREARQREFYAKLGLSEPRPRNAVTGALATATLVGQVPGFA